MVKRKLTHYDKKRKKYSKLLTQAYKRRDTARDRMSRAHREAETLIKNDKAHLKSYKNAIARYERYAKESNKQAVLIARYSALYSKVPENPDRRRKK